MLVIVQWTILGKSQYKWRGSMLDPFEGTTVTNLTNSLNWLELQYLWWAYKSLGL